MNDPAAPGSDEGPAQHPSVAGDHDHLVFTKWHLWHANREILCGVDAAFPKGRITALVGPSGAGKSCLLGSVNRLEARDTNVRVSGKATLGGVDLWGEGVDDLSLRRRSGTVFRDPEVLAGTVRENVLLPLILDGVRSAARAEDALEQVLRETLLWDTLRDRTTRDARAFPAGIRARINLARALVGRPEILLLDEPCALLDPASTELFEQAVLGLAGRCTVVIATHNLAQASRVSQRLAFLWEGRIEEYGPTHRVFQRPIRAITEDYLSGRAIT